ncbi:alpha/beta fold hydrolase [Streptomyces canus]|uniref:alpha/beta fold hydrolase n=1 Tax=Streptomyces canus TaxID=58343 RepID=UPI00382A1C4B
MIHTGTAVPTAVFAPRTGVGTARALVLAPVIPHWDEGAFFAPVVRTLTGAGLGVTVVDTLSLWDEEVDSMASFVARWRALLPRFGPVDLLCGNALGGAVAQALLPYVDPTTAALLVSGPARTDPLLEDRLTDIANLAAAGRTEAALALLHRRVQPGQGDPPDDTEPTNTACDDPRLAAADSRSRPATTHGTARRTRVDAVAPSVDADGPTPPTNLGGGTGDPVADRRLAAGMRLLCGTDVSDAVLAHPGPLLQIVGGRSQLVTLRHTAAAPHHRAHVVPEAGMRPHAEQPTEVAALIEAFLWEKGFQ